MPMLLSTKNIYTKQADPLDIPCW